jgi:rhamnulokinase
VHVAIDLGAGSGRAVAGGLADGGLWLRELHRFRYSPSRHDGHLRWPSRAILEGIETGLAAAGELARAEGRPLESVGVDSWGVDYGLVDAAGRLVEEPVAYRDERTAREMEAAFAVVARDEIFRRTGIQFMVFNTIYQLRAAVREGIPAAARRLLMIPDLCHQHLCGSERGEYTNASTTQLLDARKRTWDVDLVASLGLPAELLPELGRPGDVLGALRPELQRALGLPPLRVVAPPTHDTGSAVAGTPLPPGWAYISSGTWSLVGVELPEPLIDDQVARANFTNEGGAYGSVRFLKNVMGLWLLESCRREWAEAGLVEDLDTLLRGVAALEGASGLVFPDDPRFLNPASMTGELRRALEETGQDAPADPVRLARVVLDSLALRYASVLRTVERLTGNPLQGVRVVGGGSRNDYLNQATADASGRPVLAGPEEATAVGNLLVQAIASGHARSLAEGREAVARSLPARAFEPRRSMAWREAAGRYGEIEGLHARDERGAP